MQERMRTCKQGIQAGRNKGIKARTQIDRNNGNQACILACMQAFVQADNEREIIEDTDATSAVGVALFQSVAA